MVIFTVIGILALIAVAVMTTISKSSSKKIASIVPTKLTRIIIALVGVVLILLGATIQIIPTGYTGVRATFGQISEKPVDNGFAATIPFVQTMTKINNKQQTVVLENEIWGETKNKTPVFATDTVISYKISAAKSAWIVANIADINNLIDGPTVASSIKSAMVELDEETVTVRSKIEPIVLERLQKSFDEKYGQGTVEIVKVVINNMDFEQSYNDAIAQKSIARQIQEKQAIENQTNIEKAEADKKVAIAAAEAKAEAKRIEAEAEAEANRKISASLTEDIIDNKAVDKWDGKLPVVSGGNSIVDVGDIFGNDGGN